MYSEIKIIQAQKNNYLNKFYLLVIFNGKD